MIDEDYGRGLADLLGLQNAANLMEELWRKHMREMMIGDDSSLLKSEALWPEIIYEDILDAEILDD